MLVTKNGYALRFNIEEVPVIGAKAAGVKAINLKDVYKRQVWRLSRGSSLVSFLSLRRTMLPIMLMRKM